MYRPVKYLATNPNGNVLSDGSAVPAVILGAANENYTFVSPGGVTFSISTGASSTPYILEVTIQKMTAGSKVTLLSQ